jgi:KTSC domain
VQRERLMSNAIVSAGYDPAARELELEFRSGHVYRYEGVPASVHAWLLRTKNKGGFVRRMIAGRYPERPVVARAGAGGPCPEGASLEEALRASLEQLAKPSG